MNLNGAESEGYLLPVHSFNEIGSLGKGWSLRSVAWTWVGSHLRHYQIVCLKKRGWSLLEDLLLLHYMKKGGV